MLVVAKTAESCGLMDMVSTLEYARSRHEWVE
jgi:hypothetical protein